MIDSPYRLRPDPRALIERSMTSLARAGLDTVHGKGVRSDDRIAELVRSAQTPTSTADAQALMQTSLHLVAALQESSAAANVIASSLQLEFGNKDPITAPGLSLPYAVWVEEGGPIPVFAGKSVATKLSKRFVAAIFGLTREQADSSNAEQIMRQVMLENIGPTLDRFMFSTAAATDKRPAGILAGIDPLQASAAASASDAMIEDLQSLARSIAPVSGASRPFLVCAPEQAVSLALRSPREAFPFAASTSLAKGTAIIVVPAALATSIGVPNISPAKHATANMDTDPADIVDASGTPASLTISFFQIDSIGLLFRLQATWALRSPSAVAWLQSVKW
ncbi:hypothetical protein [Bradyrhizobium sp. USDA 4508]